MNRICVLILVLLSACSGQNAPVPVVADTWRYPVSTTSTVVFIGDSITYNWHDLATLIPGSVNSGISGNTTAQMASRFESDALSYHPETIIILGGTNDLYRDPAPSPLFIWQMVEQATAAGARVLVGTIPPLADSDPHRADVLAWNSEIRLGAISYGYTVVDYYPVLVNFDGTQNMKLFHADLTHPNDLGYEAMWTVLAPLLIKSTSP